MSSPACLSDTASMLRSAQQYLRATAAARQPRSATPSAAASAAVAVTASDGHYPTTAQAVYFVTPQEIDADDAEGAAATFSGDADQNFYALNLGTAVPPQGTEVLCHSVGGRWCFRWDG